MLQIDSFRDTELNGKSLRYLHNAIVAVQTIIDVLQHFKGKAFEDFVPANDIGIVTAYSAQVSEIKAGLRAANEDNPSLR